MQRTEQAEVAQQIVYDDKADQQSWWYKMFIRAGRSLLGSQTEEDRDESNGSDKEKSKLGITEEEQEADALAATSNKPVGRTGLGTPAVVTLAV